MRTTYTVGPWECYQKLTGDTSWRITNLYDRFDIALVQKRADADLITAAPQMLEALEDVSYYLPDLGVPRHVLGQVERAIEKAKGKAA